MSTGRALSPPRRHQNGRIDLIIGPMFAGKTTELMRRVKREIHAKNSCYIIKYAADTRYDAESVASHDQLMLRATASVKTLAEVGSTWENFDVIAVDEGQFFPDVLEFAETAADQGKIVIISALDGDFKRQPFGKICELIPHCENIIKLQAVCMMCHERDASFTRRTVSSCQQELIGGSEMYIATCRKCFNHPECPTPRRITKMKDSFREVEKLTTAAVISDNVSSPNSSEDGPAAKRKRLENSPLETSPKETVAN